MDLALTKDLIDNSIPFADFVTGIRFVPGTKRKLERKNLKIN